MLRFSIRDTILLTAIIALALAWYLDRRNLMEKASIWEHRSCATSKRLQDLGWEVTYENGKVWISQDNQHFVFERP
jgi:hypothetical protein